MININYQPLQDIADDKLGFKDTSLSIAQFIDKFPNNQPFSIAVFGKWGSGKSTMLNFVENQLDSQKNVIIKFNPWQILNDDNLIASVFEEIAHSINNKSYQKLKTKVLEYGRKVCVSSVKIFGKSFLSTKGLNDEVSESVADIGSSIVDSMFNSNEPIPLSVRKAELEKELLKWSKKENKKIVIFIDEIDRLFPDEIIDIFKVIKGVISFPSVVFVVAMDKSSVSDSLLAANIRRPDEYLTKIFQRCYFINTNYQLQTLYKELLLPNLQLSIDESNSAFIEASDIIIMLQREKFIIQAKEESKKNDVIKYYYDVYRQISEYLSVPRVFINFISFVLSNWNDFASNIKLNKENSRDCLTAFLIFTLYYINPDFVEIRSLGNRENFDKLEFPEIFKLIRYKLFKSTTPQQSYGV